jgi:FkbM family methyltransferase
MKTQTLQKFNILGHEVFQFLDENCNYYEARNLLYYDYLTITPFLPKGEIHYVDIGARNGDSIRELVPSKDRVKSVVCFEPNPEEFEKLKIVAEKNSLESSLHQFAISEKSGTLEFVWNEEERNGGLKNETSLSQSWGSEKKFKCLCWEDFDEDLKIKLAQANFIKVDTEGSDIESLMQLESVIKKNKPTILMEWFPSTEQKISGFCKNFQYQAIDPETRRPPTKWCHNLILIPVK